MYYVVGVLCKCLNVGIDLTEIDTCMDSHHCTRLVFYLILVAVYGSNMAVVHVINVSIVVEGKEEKCCHFLCYSQCRVVQIASIPSKISAIMLPMVFVKGDFVWMFQQCHDKLLIIVEAIL